MVLSKTLKSIIAFISRYKLYHLAFWSLYHYFWWALMSGSAVEAVQNIFFSAYSTKFIFYVVMQALGVYFNLYFLIPRFLQKGNYLVYIPMLLLTVLTTSAGIIGGYYVNAAVVGLPFEELFKIAPTEFFTLFKSNALPSTLASMTLAMSIKLTKNWMASEKRRNTIEKEKLQTELKFLRSQFNPHFLFNTINSIFVLIHKDQDKASNSLAKFSELLRYQLYQCNEPFIPLEQELDYLVNFIELEKLRQESELLELNVDLDKTTSLTLEIAPFLMIPFVENAFKHVSYHKNAKNWIDIQLRLEQSNLQLMVSNSRNPLVVEKENGVNGIGLANVKRRLELLYPNAHKLEIIKDNLQHAIKLDLKLQQLEVVKSQIA
ncbi:sensor histidine kinase [Poritiphilus flavus]|uniref:Sensor histidine kinase n=1 Tax=Poritiphilus flavus TaxID=2697053 RepID=A0A6L9E8U9_9FLAO|nr:histidine kinase [Poritiphilus flavus]NAS11146.1 sensor histidine kinase [Poritiphilus flavus]